MTAAPRLVALLLLAVLAVSPARAAPVPVWIDISSRWASLDNGGHRRMHIRLVHGHYVRDGHRIGNRAVNGLLAALAEPVIDHPDPANLGIDAAWIAHQAAAPSAAIDYQKNLAPNQLALYRKLFTDPQIFHELVTQSFDSSLQDEFKEFTVTIKFSDESIATIKSNKETVFYLPYRVTRGGMSVVTYNADIPRALAALVGPDQVDYGSLKGGGLDYEIGDLFAKRFRRVVSALGVLNRAGPDVVRLQDRYAVQSAEIRFPPHPLFPAILYSEPESLLLELHRSPMPEKFVARVSLPFRQKKIEGLDRFLASMPDYEDLVLSVPWLMRYRQAHPGTSFRLFYSGTQSLDNASMALFTADMQRASKDALAADAGALQGKTALLLSGGAETPAVWLVLPDGRMVLWRFAAGADLLQWKDGDIARTPCSQDGETTTYCPGAIMSPDGSLTR